MPIDDGTFDAVMFNFVLGHALLDKCLSEASRVLRPGGLCFAYDLTTDAQSIDYVISRLGYKPHPSDEVVSTARRRGLESGIVIDGPPASIADFVTLFGAAEFYRVGLDRTRPIIYRFTKAVHCPVADDERHGVVAREARLDKTIAS
jgi:SAM-dependent methyltransferase